MDSNSVLHLVYGESPQEPFGEYQVHYTRSKNSGQSFEKPQEISKPEPQSIESWTYPEIAVDGKNRIFIKWEVYPDHKERPKGLGYTISGDGGLSFADPQMIPQSLDHASGGNGSHQGLLMKKISMNETGEVIVANSSLKTGSQSRVWFLRGKLISK